MARRDASIDAFLGAAGADCRALAIAETLHSDCDDTGWLYSHALIEYATSGLSHLR